MRWGLLFDDIAARLFGLIGIYVCVLYANMVLEPTIADLAVELKAGLFVFAGAGALTYLIPSFHDSAIKVSRGFFGRLIFVLASLAWALLIALGLELSHRLGIGHLPEEPAKMLPLVMLVGFAFYVLLFLFPLGISYRYAAEFEPPINLSTKTAPGTYHPGSDSVPEPKMMVERGPRKKDLLDRILRLPLYAVIGVSLYAFFADKVAPTAELDALATQFFWPGVAAAAALFLLKSFIQKMRRPMMYPTRVPLLKRILFVIVALPILSIVVFLFAAYHGLPWAWQQWKPGTEGAREYFVVESNLANVVPGCVGLHYPDQETRIFTLCALEAALADDLQPGDRIEATGALTQFSHVFETVTVTERATPAPVAPRIPDALLINYGQPLPTQ